MGRIFLASFAWFLLFLPAGNPWIGVLVDEPFTLVGASRVVSGEVPYRDFFFLWTPGVLYLHAALHAFTNEWLFSGRVLIALLGVALLYVNYRAAKLAKLSSRGLFLVVGLSLAWGVVQWNQPYSSWYAILCLLFLAPFLGHKNFLAGLLVAIAFWFKQNIGLYGFVFAVAYLLYRFGTKSILRFVFGALLGLLPGFLYFWQKGALRSFLSQTLLFPWTYKEVMAYSITEVEFFHPLLGLFFILTLLGSAFSLAVYWRNRNAIDSNLEKHLWMAGAGFLQIYPRFDFTHFVFSFSCVLVPLIWAIDFGAKKFHRLGYGLLLLLMFTGFWRSGVLLADTWGGSPVYGLRSKDFIHEYLTEIQSVSDYLYKSGMRSGDMVLQIPVSTAFYLYSGFRNGTPFDQFFPQYVEAFGAEQGDVLSGYLERGGKYVVLDRNAKAEEYVPRLMEILKRDFYEVQRFPLTLSVWAPHSMLKK